MLTVSRRRLFPLAASGMLLRPGQASAATGKVDDTGFPLIGGIQQWISVQGADAANPVILYLHGGPGEAQSPFPQQFAPWERDFTVAIWDQRGAGKTFQRNGTKTPDVTLERMVADTIEVAENLCKRLGQRKLILVGQSWGSLLGVHAIKKRPELFHAYVGTGQFVSLAAGYPYQVQAARKQATATGNETALKELDVAEAAPAAEREMKIAIAVNRFLVSQPDLPHMTMVRDFMEDANKHPKGVAGNWLAGTSVSRAHLMDTVRVMDIRMLGLDMPIPFFIVQGRDDRITPFEAAQAYAESIKAPAKAFVPIDGGHYACFSNAPQFVVALNQYVRPLTA